MKKDIRKYHKQEQAITPEVRPVPMGGPEPTGVPITAKGSTIIIPFSHLRAAFEKLSFIFAD